MLYIYESRSIRNTQTDDQGQTFISNFNLASAKIESTSHLKKVFGLLRVYFIFGLCPAPYIPFAFRHGT